MSLYFRECRKEFELYAMKISVIRADFAVRFAYRFSQQTAKHL
jgi:hypothetical protein